MKHRHANSKIWNMERKTGQHLRANPLILLAEWTGLEPATPGVTGRYSNQLNYHSCMISTAFAVVGAEGIEPPTFAL